MAQSLDLEEQEQLDQIKHFWKRYGNLITWLLLAASLSFASWNGWQYWQHKQAAGAAVLFDEIERAVVDKDAARTERALTDIKDKFGGTVYAQQGALLAARGLHDAGDSAKAKQALEWAAAQTKDEGLQAIARLRLAGLVMDTGTPEEAKKLLEANMPAAFEGLVADRQGDVHMLSGQSDQARQAYLKAYQLLADATEYRRLVEIKLNALGVDPSAASPRS